MAQKIFVVRNYDLASGIPSLLVCHKSPSIHVLTFVFDDFADQRKPGTVPQPLSLAFIGLDLVVVIESCGGACAFVSLMLSVMLLLNGTVLLKISCSCIVKSCLSSLRPYFVVSQP
jgi:hypothetical protein